MDSAIRKSSSRARRSMWITIGAGVVLLALIGIGVGVGVSVAKKNSSPKSAVANGNAGASTDGSSGGSTSGGSNAPSDGGTVADPNDPSNFSKDARLHKSFYGLAYTPDGSIMPDCGATLPSVIRDVQIMSQLTTRLRLYGSDCNQTALVLEAIKQTKVDLSVYVGNYVEADDNGAAYQRQRDTMKAALQTYGVDHVLGVTVGNEFMLNYLNGGDDPNSAMANTGAAILIADIKDTRDMLTSLNLPKTLPVGTSDAGSYFNTEVLEAVDYGMSNVHAWFASVDAAGAAAWVFDFFNETNVTPAAALANSPKMYIAETGWPTNSSDVAHETNGPGTASVAGLQTFLDTFVCQANSAGIGYFFFEFFDEEWKDALYGGVEGWWGLFDKDRNLKPITIPNCASP
ncbi:glycoside hydrolase [Pluteus cervinus]|uniref:Glycoside hydrolase n=1 Tax=Pluteus cervinus TaxID=181527 RepID=A0ACD3B1A1_9AGAR|nr:glycoside hydrolase [Pluteus cervinus]